MAKRSLLRTEWTCDRCKHVEESTNTVVADSVGALVDVDIAQVVNEAELPLGWGHFTYAYARGGTLAQDLCLLCVEQIDGVASRRLIAVEPEEDKPGPGSSNNHPPTKRTAKKTTKKASAKRASSTKVSEDQEG
jgi:hypothetical protein